jgi:hypothetical protein
MCPDILCSELLPPAVGTQDGNGGPSKPPFLFLALGDLTVYQARPLDALTPERRRLGSRNSSSFAMPHCASVRTAMRLSCRSSNCFPDLKRLKIRRRERSLILYRHSRMVIMCRASVKSLDTSRTPTNIGLLFCRNKFVGSLRLTFGSRRVGKGCRAQSPRLPPDGRRGRLTGHGHPLYYLGT